MGIADAWKELKEFNDCEPSALAFRAMVGLLDSWPTSDQAEAIVYAEQLLHEWPDAVRVAPWSWCKAASRGIVHPTWQLVRSLELSSGHLTKKPVDLNRLAHNASLQHITELELSKYSDFKELSVLYHRPELFRGLKHLRATDKYDDGDVRAIAASPIWNSLESFDTESVVESFAHGEPSRIIPQLNSISPIRHLSLRASDLISVWNASDLPKVRSVCVFIRSIEEAKALSARKELTQLNSLSIAFRCGFSGRSPFEPFVGTVVAADEVAANAFFCKAKLDQLEKLTISGYSMGYWGREGLGRHGLKALLFSGLLKRLKQLRLERLPLGDKGVATLAYGLGKNMESLELVDVYCKGKGAAALCESPCMSSLRHLDLSANRIDSARIEQMAKVSMPHLESLDLSGPEINPYYWNVGVQPILDAGAKAWASSDNAKCLKSLRLSNCHLTDAGLTAIFQSSQFQGLTELDLSHSSFTASGVSQIVGSQLWQTLKRLSLNGCRLNNAAIEALTGVSHAPALRSLELAYNCIGPKGATALASWSVLEKVWQLNLHDNFIGDEGLVALSQSTNLSRLLELDFEQDCWNSRAFQFSDSAANAFAESASFPNLDCLFSGRVDEYHGAAYSPGFTKDAIGKLRTSKWMRPALKAALSDFSGIYEYNEGREFDENRELDDHDFRAHPFELNEKEAEQSEHRMRQLSSPRSPDRAIDKLGPAKISPLPEIIKESDAIEGLEFRDPIPVRDHFATLTLSLGDVDRPLPEHVGKLLCDTLRSIFRACSIGDFEVGGGGSRTGEDGSLIETDVFYVSISGAPAPALQLIREALWWVGAPKDTELKDFPLALEEPPETTTVRFLQLSNPKITRWSSGYRIDRVAFSREQRNTIQNIISDLGSSEPIDGWVRCAMHDGGKVSIYTKYLDKSDDFDTLNFLVDSLTPNVSGLIHRMMLECAFVLYPMAMAPDEAVAQTIVGGWPKAKIVTSVESLHELLMRGAYNSWRDKSI